MHNHKIRLKRYLAKFNFSNFGEYLSQDEYLFPYELAAGIEINHWIESVKYFDIKPDAIFANTLINEINLL